MVLLTYESSCSCLCDKFFCLFLSTEWASAARVMKTCIIRQKQGLHYKEKLLSYWCSMKVCRDLKDQLSHTKKVQTCLLFLYLRVRICWSLLLYLSRWAPSCCYIWEDKLLLVVAVSEQLGTKLLLYLIIRSVACCCCIWASGPEVAVIPERSNCCLLLLYLSR